MTETRQQRRAHARATATPPSACPACGTPARHGTRPVAAIDAADELRFRPGHDPATAIERAIVRRTAALLNRAGVRKLARRAQRLRSTPAGVLLADARKAA